jgi:hypothetical protein
MRHDGTLKGIKAQDNKVGTGREMGGRLLAVQGQGAIDDVCKVQFPEGTKVSTL